MAEVKRCQTRRNNKKNATLIITRKKLNKNRLGKLSRQERRRVGRDIKVGVLPVKVAAIQGMADSLDGSATVAGDSKAWNLLNTSTDILNNMLSSIVTALRSLV